MLKRQGFGFSENFFVFQFIWITFLFLTHLVSQSYAVIFGSENGSSIGSFAMLNLDNEANIPAWYSACALFLCAVLAGVIAYSRWQMHNGARYKWAGLGIVFAYLSLDESASFHEGFIPGLLRKLDLGLVPGVPFDWAPFGMALFALFALIYLRFWLKLPPKTRFLFAISAGIFLLGAVGFEKVSHFYEALYQTENTLSYVVTCGIEEFLEMFGIAIFNYALLSYICENIGFVSINNAPQQRAFAKEQLVR